MSGFTLLELLVVIAIIMVLALLVFKGAKSAMRQGSLAKEVSAARQIMGAYLTYAADNNGDLMPGYGPFPAHNERGEDLHNPVNARYAWRLAPYLKYDMRVLWGNNNDDALHKLFVGSRADYEYGVSVQPALGINAIFVGGDYQDLPPNKAKAIELYGDFCVTRLVAASNPSKLIVFASAGSIFQGQRLSGYFKVVAPYTTGRNWGRSWTEKSAPNEFGNVDFRYDGRAVAAMLDGHVEVLNCKQMDDMQYWSSQAAESFQKDWTLQGH